ncbi:MAG: MopE-related protein [Myxococcota bacterium]|nr:MopE-related protein [Myxococcota bacterium]
MNRLTLTLALTSVLLAAGCDCSGTPSPTRCESADDCEAGSRCIDGVCEPIGDAGEEDSGVGAACVDVDRDGHSAIADDCPSGDDCDDTDATVHPGVAETCGDGVDNDCDGTADEPDCDCRRGDRVVCYSGDVATAGVGACRNGVAICSAPGMIGECRGERLPGEETCDGTDEDCDGTVDEGLRNACGECGPEPTEMCGNDVDDDCDGMTDEDCECDYRCECATGTSCVCEPPTNQPCYEGPFGTGGVGVCSGGRRDCLADAATGENRWGSCDGQVLPGAECAGGAADGVDDDCDGRIDEGCADADGDGSPFPTDCDDTNADVHPGAAETCNGRDDNCNGVADEGVTNACGGCGAPAATDECGNGYDDDCDGVVDDGCMCGTGDTQTCYGGPPGTEGVGSCVAGTQTCSGSMEFPEWGACSGQVTPLPEICNGVDDDCDGEADERWASGSNACGWCDPTEICDGEDQDCDGLIDEGVRNRCGDCGPTPAEVCDGMDTDCDGAIDEGVVNACGTCPPMPCFTETWGTPADCMRDGRTCDDVEEDPMYPGSVTLGSSTVDFDYIYIAVTARNEVAQLDTRTGVKNWQVPSHGRYPSRTAVASDGSVWVGNRAMTGSNPADPAQSNVVHLRASDGGLICRAPVLNVARSVAIDRNGDIWAGSYNNGDLYHISGTMVDTTTTPPTCVVLRTINVGQNIYGLTADPDGYVWTSSSPTIRVDIATYAQTSFTNPSHYGISPDGANRVWFGGWRGSGTVHALDRTTGAVLNTTVSQVTAVTTHPSGNIYGSAYGTNQIVGIDGTTGAELCRAAVPSGTNPHGVAVDRMGRIWMPSRFGSGTVNVYDTSCAHLGTYTVDAGQELYSYSDMTGHLLRTFVSPEGRWEQVFDSGYALAYWTTVDWTSIEPPGTDIEVTARTADTLATLDAGVACGPFNTSPADLSSCPPGFQNHRYLRVETRLTRTGTERPILQSVSASWAY